MKPNRGEGMSGHELQPAALPEVSQDSGDSKAEQAPARPESSPSQQPTPPPLTPVQVALPDDISAPVVPSDDDQKSTTVPTDNAKNTDRIDKHWVDSAKSIINQSRDDPYKQKNEMSKVKADYIKQRFNKVVKADQGAA